MIDLISDLPDNVVAITASGQVSGADYEDVIVPLVEKKISQYGTVRLLYHLGPDFRRFTTTALWDDAKIGFHHLKDFGRVAVVTDVAWIQTMIRGAGKTGAVEIRGFANDELDEAKSWISA
jgi:hypothetical protein